MNFNTRAIASGTVSARVYRANTGTWENLGTIASFNNKSRIEMIRTKITEMTKKVL